MQDRVPTHPGRVKLTPVPGQTNMFDLVRADDPLEEGTPLCKKTLLRDVTAAGIGELPTDPTVDDALMGLQNKMNSWNRFIYTPADMNIIRAIGVI